jgi:hypothetical protein
MTIFEATTMLSPDDLDNHAFSIAANEQMLEVNDPAEKHQFTCLASDLRSMECVHVHDGAPLDPVLQKLRALALLEDEEEGELKALYAVRTELRCLAAAY